jgi:superfamily I DNA and RNA helicase
MQRITGNLREDICTFMTISRLILLRMRNIVDKFCRENENTFLVQLPYPEYGKVYEIMWTNLLLPDRPQITI